MSQCFVLVVQYCSFQMICVTSVGSSKPIKDNVAVTTIRSQVQAILQFKSPSLTRPGPFLKH